MIVSQAEMDLVLNSRIRRRVVHLPVRHGQFGERKRCPVKEGSVCRLQAPVPYERYRVRAEREPTRARAVLSLIDRCLLPNRSLRVTVSAPPALELIDARWVWVVRFMVGEHDLIDRDVFLKRGGGYTTARDELDAGVVLVVGDAAERARVWAEAKRQMPQREAIGRARRELETLSQSLSDMKHRNLAKRAERTLAALERQLPAEEVLRSPTLGAAPGSATDRLPTPSTSASPEVAA